MNLQDVGQMLEARNWGGEVPMKARNQWGGPMTGGLENLQLAGNVPRPTGAVGRAATIQQDQMEWQDYYTNFQPTDVEPEPLPFEAWRTRKYGPGTTTNPYQPR